MRPVAQHARVQALAGGILAHSAAVARQTYATWRPWPGMLPPLSHQRIHPLHYLPE
jgi:hypothetical protein